MSEASPDGEKKVNPLVIILIGAVAGLALGFVGFQFLPAPEPQPAESASLNRPGRPLGSVPRASLNNTDGSQDPFDMILQSPSRTFEKKLTKRRINRVTKLYHSIVRRYASNAFLQEWTREFFSYPDLAEIYRKHDGGTSKDPVKFAFGVLSSPNFYGMVKRNISNPNLQNIFRASLMQPEFLKVADEFKGTPEADKLFKTYENATGLPLRDLVAGKAPENPTKVVQDILGKGIQQVQQDLATQQRGRR